MIGRFSYQKDEISKDELGEIAGRILKENGAVIDDHYAPAEIFSALAGALNYYMVEQQLPVETKIQRPFGPLEMPVIDPEFDSVSTGEALELSKKAGINLDEIQVPPYLPDVDDVKKDIGDYYEEIQNFDRDVASYIQLLKEMGQLENTLVIVCSDNGWQMPRGLANLYDFGTRVPLIISMPSRYKAGRVIDDFISLNDFAPTFLELAGIPIPGEMNTRSFVDILESEEEGIVDPTRSFIVTARETHAFTSGIMIRKAGLLEIRLFTEMLMHI